MCLFFPHYEVFVAHIIEIRCNADKQLILAVPPVECRQTSASVVMAVLWLSLRLHNFLYGSDKVHPPHICMYSVIPIGSTSGSKICWNIDAELISTIRIVALVG